MAEEELLRAAASKAEARLDALEAVFKERDELKAKVAELAKSEERLRYQVLHLCKALDAKREAARGAVELVSSSTADDGRGALKEKVASLLLGDCYLSEEDEKERAKS